jgi:hypothetical protein
LTLNIISFVDRDMVMRYFGGGIGHLKNTPPQQVPGFDPIDPSSEEMAMEEGDNDDGPSGTNEDLGTIVQQPSRDIVINSGELDMSEGDEANEDDEGDEVEDEDNDEDSDDSDEGGDQTDEDEDDESGRSGDEEEEGEGDYGYASP